MPGPSLGLFGRLKDQSFVILVELLIWSNTHSVMEE